MHRSWFNVLCFAPECDWPRQCIHKLPALNGHFIVNGMPLQMLQITFKPLSITSIHPFITSSWLITSVDHSVAAHFFGFSRVGGFFLDLAAAAFVLVFGRVAVTLTTADTAAAAYLSWGDMVVVGVAIVSGHGSGVAFPPLSSSSSSKGPLDALESNLTSGPSNRPTTFSPSMSDCWVSVALFSQSEGTAAFSIFSAWFGGGAIAVCESDGFFQEPVNNFEAVTADLLVGFFGLDFLGFGAGALSWSLSLSQVAPFRRFFLRFLGPKAASCACAIKAASASFQ